MIKLLILFVISVPIIWSNREIYLKQKLYITSKFNSVNYLKKNKENIDLYKNLKQSNEN